MKISDPGNIVNKAAPEHKKHTGSNKAAFEAHLQKNMAPKAAKASSVPDLQALNAAARVALETVQDHDSLASRISSLLDLMETYSRKLGSASALKDISPVVHDLERETDSLKSVSETLPPHDEIKPVLDEVLIRSSVEIIKFNRGDYL